MRIRKLIASAMVVSALASMLSFPSLAAGWQHNETGYWYEREDCSYPAGTWEQIDGTWYLFDQNGYMLTGWQQAAGEWYYLGNDGAMAAGVTLSIDGVPYTFSSSGAMMDQTDAVPVKGHWMGRTYVNEWSNIQLTVPQGFICLDSGSLSGQLDSMAAVDMVSMKNRECAIMVLYPQNKDGEAADELMSFLNTFHGGYHQIEGLGAMENVTVGSLSYLRCHFPGSEENPRSGYLYIRNMGSFYSMIITDSNPENVPVMDSILSTLTTAH